MRLLLGIVTSVSVLVGGGVALSAAAGVASTSPASPSKAVSSSTRSVGTALRQLQGEAASLSTQIVTVHQALTKAAEAEQAKISQADQALAAREAALSQQEQQLAAQEAAVRQEAAQLASQAASGATASVPHGDDGGGGDD